MAIIYNTTSELSGGQATRKQGDSGSPASVKARWRLVQLLALLSKGYSRPVTVRSALCKLQAPLAMYLSSLERYVASCRMQQISAHDLLWLSSAPKQQEEIFP